MEVARSANFSEVNGALNTMKRTISYQVKTLKGDLGHALFLRPMHGVILADVVKFLE